MNFALPTDAPDPHAPRVTDRAFARLAEIAAMTGGQYFRAQDTEGLRQVYDEIDEMEKYLISVQNVTRHKELFLPFALTALGLILLELLLRRTWLRSVP